MTDFTSHETIIHDARALPVMLTGKLVGREAALAEVYSAMKARRPALISGPAGAGKTALAATLAAAYIQQTGAVLWLRVHQPDLAELVARVGRAYQITAITANDNPLSMIGAAENTLKTQKPLLVLDGDIAAEVASRFIERCAEGIPVIIATEPKLAGNWTMMALDKLEADQGAALFKREARLATTEHDLDVYGIAKLVGYLPYGIIVAARAMLAAKQTPPAYIKLLQQVAASSGNSPLVALTASFRALTGPLQGLILLLGATDNGQATPELLAMLSGAPVDSVKQALNILTQLHLVEQFNRYDAPYYQMHPIAFHFTQGWLKSSNRLEGLQSKARDTLLAYAKKYTADTPDAYKKLATEMESFMATARGAAQQGKRTVAAELLAALSAGQFITTGGYLCEQWQLRALATGAPAALVAEPAAAQPTPPPVTPAATPVAVTDRPEDEDYLEAGAPEEDSEAVLVAAPIDLTTKDIGKLRTALATAKQSGAADLQIKALKAIGAAQIEQGMENEAIATHSDLLSRYETQDDRRGTLETLDMLAALMVKTDNLQAAILHAARGVKLADELDDADAKMHLLTTRGDAHQQLGECGDSVQDYAGAIAVARTQGDTQNEALILYKLGFAQLDNSDSESAIETWEQALKLFKAQEKRDYEGRTLGGLGSAYGDLERWGEAVNFHTSALHIARETRNKEEEALQLNNLAYAALQAEQLGEAVLRYRQALHLAYENESEDNIVSAIVDLARLLLRSRRHISAAELLINDALTYEPNDRDVRQLKERVTSERMLAEADGVALIVVNGAARDYAANAYKLLEE